MKVLGIEGEIVEVKKPVRLAVIGCGSHVYRNILPSIRFIPNAIITVFCDKNTEKAELFAKYHGVETWCCSAEELLKMFPEKFDALLVIVGFSPDTGKPLYSEIVPSFLKRGIPVWMEKPPAASCEELASFVAASKQGNTFFQTGFKMMFAPALQQVKKLMNSDKFGVPQSFDISYAVSFPSDIRDLTNINARRFLDDIVHILSQIQFLFGCPYRMTTFRGGENDAIAILEYKNGLTGAIRILGGISITGPAEYLRIVGTCDKVDNGTLIELKNSEEITLHEPGDPGAYGRDFSFIRTDGTHTHVWSPNLRKPLGALSLHSHSLYGYINELSAFVNSVENKIPSIVAGIEDTQAIMKMYDAFAADNAKPHILSKKIRTSTLPDTISIIEEFTCDNCYGRMYVKDGWTAKCENCGKTVQLIKFENRWSQTSVRRILKDVLENLSIVPETLDACLKYNKGIAKDNYRRCFVDLRVKKNAKKTYDYFIKIAKNPNDIFPETEYKALSLLKSLPFVPSVYGKPNPKYIIQQYIDGITLYSLLKTNFESCKDILLKSVKCLADFHKTFRKSGKKPFGYVHGDIDPWQIIVEKDGNITIIDWEDFKKDGNQIHDILNFVFMVGVIYLGENTSAKEKAEIILYQKSKLTELIFDMLSTYSEETLIPVKDIIDEIPCYAKNRLIRLQKMSRPSENFIYSYLLNVCKKDIVWKKTQ